MLAAFFLRFSFLSFQQILEEILGRYGNNSYLCRLVLMNFMVANISTDLRMTGVPQDIA